MAGSLQAFRLRVCDTAAKYTHRVDPLTVLILVFILLCCALMPHMLPTQGRGLIYCIWTLTILRGFCDRNEKALQAKSELLWLSTGWEITQTATRRRPPKNLGCLLFSRLRKWNVKTEIFSRLGYFQDRDISQERTLSRPRYSQDWYTLKAGILSRLGYVSRQRHSQDWDTLKTELLYFQVSQVLQTSRNKAHINLNWLYSLLEVSDQLYIRTGSSTRALGFHLVKKALRFQFQPTASQTAVYTWSSIIRVYKNTLRAQRSCSLARWRALAPDPTWRSFTPPDKHYPC